MKTPLIMTLIMGIFGYKLYQNYQPKYVRIKLANNLQAS